MWRGRVVAAKLIDCTFAARAGGSSTADVALREAALSKSLDHPCVVKTFEYAMLAADGGGGGGGGAPVAGTLWMVQQLCNHGTLIEAGEWAWGWGGVGGWGVGRWVLGACVCPCRVARWAGRALPPPACSTLCQNLTPPPCPPPAPFLPPLCPCPPRLQWTAGGCARRAA